MLFASLRRSLPRALANENIHQSRNIERRSFIKALIQLHSPLLNIDLEGECCNDGLIDLEVDVGCLEKVHWLVYCNGVRQGNFEIEDGDQINIG